MEEKKEEDNSGDSDAATTKPTSRALKGLLPFNKSGNQEDTNKQSPVVTPVIIVLIEESSFCVGNKRAVGVFRIQQLEAHKAAAVVPIPIPVVGVFRIQHPEAH